MGFKDCIATLRAAGDLDEIDAGELSRRYDDLVQSSRSSTDPRGPEMVARDELVKQLKDEAELKEHQARLQADAIDRIADQMERFRDTKGRPDAVNAALGLLENRNNLLAGAPSVVGRRDALVGYAHGRLEQLLHETRRSGGLGVRRNLVRLEDMVEGAFTGTYRDAASKDFMQAYWKVTDELIDRFNAAGGAVGKMDRYIPQRHDARALAAAGRVAWKAFIGPRLDVTAMRDPLTGGPLLASRLDEALDVIYRRIVTNGSIDKSPTGQPAGRGKLANQRQEERFLQFKDAGAWKEYNVAFGGNDVYGALMGHVHGLAKDIAAMEVLGPNPKATVEWMKQSLQQEAAKKAVGQPSLLREDVAMRSTGQLDSGDYRVQRLWDVVNGGTNVANMNAADAMQAVRNVLTAANLAGTAVTAVAGDPFQQKWARTFAGVSNMRWFPDLAKQMFDGASKREITRAGVVLEDAMQNLRTDLRFQSLAARSSELTKWLPDRIFQWTGLTPWTNANRRSQAMSFMFDAGDRAAHSLKELQSSGTQGDRFVRYLEGFGIGEDEWSVIRFARPLDHKEAGGLLRPIDIIDSAPGDDRAFDVAMRYSEAVHAFVEEAVPQGTSRVRAAMGRDTAAGTLSGEVQRSAFMYLSYPATMLSSLLRATAHELQDGTARGGGFLASTVIGLTIGGALIQTLAELRKGRDPRNADFEFWAMSIVKGGGFGFWGDYLFADMDRGPGEVAARAAGPVVGLAADAISLLGGKKFLAGEDANRARQLARMGQRYIPGQNMWWLRPATERLVWDRLQLLADPEAQRSWQRAERKLRKDTGQDLWWRRGEALPRRAPNLSNILE